VSPIHISCALQDVETLKVLVNAGADVYQEELEGGNTPLMIASQQSGGVMLVKELIAAGVR
jgi:ankyrin repeat protein